LKGLEEGAAIPLTFCEFSNIGNIIGEALTRESGGWGLGHAAERVVMSGRYPEGKIEWVAKRQWSANSW
jgi:hypothetical protein